jgi:hypothetical protein
MRNAMATAKSRRELFDTGTKKLFVRRNAPGPSFKRTVDAGRLIAADKRRQSSRKMPPGLGDQGDRR